MRRTTYASHALLLATLLALPFERIPSIHPMIGQFDVTIRISQILGLVLISINLPLLWRVRRQLVDSPWRWLVLFNIVSLISALTATSPKRGLMVFCFIAFVSALSWTIANILDPTLLARYKNALVIAALFACAVGFYQFFGDLLGLSTHATGLREQYTKAVFGFPRMQSTALEPLYFADFLLIPAALLATLLLFRRKINGLLLLPLLVCIFLTVSRGAYAGIIVILIGLLGAGVASKKYTRSGLLILTALLAVALTISLVGVSSKIDRSHKAVNGSNVQHFTKQSTNLNQGESSEGRTLTRNLAIKAFRQHPLIGVGPGNFGFFAHAQMPLKFTSNAAIVNNEPLEILAEQGILGGIFILLFALSVLHKAGSFILWKTAPTERRIYALGLMAALIGISVQYQTFSTLYITHVWVAIGLLLGVTVRNRELHASKTQT